MSSKADVHIHSLYSDRPSEWILRRIGAPESFVQPLDIYRRCRERGMDFVTVSDHNRIEGALDIAHLPGTFISSEITSYFPEDGCKVHVLVLGISEEQFSVIQSVRENLYDFCDYVEQQGIVASLAHPLFRVNDRLTVDHLEKLILLFNRFEGINGTRNPRACHIAQTVLDALTPEDISRLADRHGIEPIGPTPWRKVYTAGSDDHGGLYMARAYTTTPTAATVDEYLSYLRSGDHEPAGEHGTSLQLAHSFYQIAYSFYKSRFLGDGGGGPNVLGELFARLLEPAVPVAAAGGRLGRLAGLWGTARRVRQFSEPEQKLLDEMIELFRESQAQQAAEEEARRAASGNGHPAYVRPVVEADEHAFDLACNLCDRVGHAFFTRCLSHIGEGRVVESLQTLASLGPVALAMAPYLAAFRTQHKDETFLQSVAGHFPAAEGMRLRSDRRAWVTDTYVDINGVGRTVRMMARLAAAAGKPLTVLTCLDDPPADDLPVKNFKPAGMFEMPEYPSQKLSAPPFLRIVEYLERERFSEVVISTPGPLGLAALAAARLLKLRTVGVYHTDWPRYVLDLTADAGLESLARQFGRWFYGQMDLTLVPSRYYMEELEDEGWPVERLKLLPRGVDRQRFHPGRRVADWWQRRGLKQGFVFLYAGRVSREKNLEPLLEAFAALRQRHPLARLAIAGDGPLREELQAGAPAGVCFAGWLEGDDLATAYASADAFVFPSTTDTFGNAVLEAQASGLPAIVSPQGGPQEIVGRRQSGIVAAGQASALEAAMARLIEDHALRQSLAERALLAAADHDWQKVFDTLWAQTPPHAGRAASPSRRRRETEVVRVPR